ncbi:ATP synthase subunit s, mitochondrial-like isoform X2 [Physella acuta]|uniref:ATP synthase subunit s, mitochondrial-like isoform X2 n=1 Tax=Physella acuta TaxID=109671 RepID=UPI0027DCDCCB|nr:ATP synthase subunit s, mitochondrial-like isoform X2 [Physella acuta]
MRLIQHILRFRPTVIISARQCHILSTQAAAFNKNVSAAQHYTVSKQYNLLLLSPIYAQSQKREFWGIDVAFNKVDEERVKLAGPDRAAAEWILRNGGSIKWTMSSNHLNDYNLLPTTSFEDYKIEEIDLTATDVINMGFEHLNNLQHVKKIRLHGCRCISDEALGLLVHVKDTLVHLEKT